MDNFSLKNTINSNERGGAEKSINQAEYVQALTSLANSLNSINNSVAQIQNQIQQMNQIIVQSHNINSALISNLQEGIVRCMPKADINFRIALAEHCNLNCAGCDHFSPLAKPQFANFEETERDFTRLAELFEDNVGYIHLEGGEPLLHPEIIKFLEMTRQKFPTARINIITNGLKLLSMPEEFWKSCRSNKIVIFPTKYPVQIDYEKIKKKAEKSGVKFVYFSSGETIKTLFKLPLDLEGTLDGRQSFLYCHRANYCIYLQNGRLYTCTVAPTARHFDNKFGTHLFDEESNSIDIYKANSAQEILEFLAKPIPFCRYCKIQETVNGIPWHQSKKNIDEWT